MGGCDIWRGKIHWQSCEWPGCHSKPLCINTPQDFEADTVYYKTVYYTSISPKIVKVGRRWKWHRCDGALTSSFGHTLMDLYQSLHFELFPCIIYIYIVENILLTSYFECLYSLCAKSNSAAYNMIFTSLCCVITLKIILCVIKFLFKQLMTS